MAKEDVIVFKKRTMVRWSRQLMPVEIAMARHGTCPACLKPGMDFRLHDNDGHGGIVECPSCGIVYHPNKPWDDSGLYFGSNKITAICDECDAVAWLVPDRVTSKKGNHVLAFSCIDGHAMTVVR